MGAGIVLIALYLALAKRIKDIRGMAGSGHQVAGDLWKIVRSDQSRSEQPNQWIYFVVQSGKGRVTRPVEQFYLTDSEILIISFHFHFSTAAIV